MKEGATKSCIPCSEMALSLRLSLSKPARPPSLSKATKGATKPSPSSLS